MVLFFTFFFHILQIGGVVGFNSVVPCKAKPQHCTSCVERRVSSAGQQRGGASCLQVTTAHVEGGNVERLCDMMEEEQHSSGKRTTPRRTCLLVFFQEEIGMSPSEAAADVENLLCGGPARHHRSSCTAGHISLAVLWRAVRASQIPWRAVIVTSHSRNLHGLTQTCVVLRTRFVTLFFLGCALRALTALRRSDGDISVRFLALREEKCGALTTQ